jgi:hypothetical protein
MKQALIALALIFSVGCTPFPQTLVQMRDARGNPIIGFPLKVEFSEGIHRVTSGANATSKTELNEPPLVVKTGRDGNWSFEYNFTKRQPSQLRMLLLSAPPVPNQWIRITPLRAVPKGSSITVGIPNP